MRSFHVLVGEMQVHRLTYRVQAPDAEAAQAYVAGDDSAAWIREDTPDPVLIEDEHTSTVNVEDLGVVEED